MRFIVISFCLLTACQQSEDVRKHRFLLKGNAALEEQNEEQALQYFQEAIEIDSCFSDAYNNIGTVYFRQQKFLEALESYNHSIACNPGFLNTYFNRANTLYELNRSTLAMFDVEKVLLEKPDTVPALFLQGLIFTRTREFARAKDSFLKIAHRDSMNSEVYVNLGNVCYFQKQYDEAITYLKKAISLNPKEADAFNALSLVETANGDLLAAMQSIQMAITLKPGNAFYKNNRGYIYLLKGELQLALEDIDYSITTDPYNGWAYRNKGIYYLKTGDATSAIRLLKQAIELEPFVEMGYYFLAEAYLKTGNKVKACQAFTESVNRGEVAKTLIGNFCR